MGDCFRSRALKLMLLLCMPKVCAAFSTVVGDGLVQVQEGRAPPQLAITSWVALVDSTAPAPLGVMSVHNKQPILRPENTNLLPISRMLERGYLCVIYFTISASNVQYSETLRPIVR